MADTEVKYENIRLLGLVPANRHTTLPATGRGATQTPVAYEDFTLDGMRLYELLFPDHDPDEVSSFDASWPEGAVNAANEFLGEREPELDDGRIPLYVCPECADLGCGALTVDVERNGEFVVWKNFGWQTNYKDGWDIGDYKHLADVEPIVFDRSQYDAVFKEALERYAALPAPERFAPSLFARVRRCLGL